MDIRATMMGTPLLALVNPQHPVRLNRGALAGLAGVEGETGVVPTILSLASLAAGIALTYHGYKRNDSVLWALSWGLFGGMIWPITLPIAFGQGYGKPRVKK